LFSDEKSTIMYTQMNRSNDQSGVFAMNEEDFHLLIERSTSRSYAGVGSRETPPQIGALMCAIAMKLSEKDWTLASGAADGADLAFESGVPQNGKKHIFLPYPGFNGSTSKKTQPAAACFDIASRVHGHWDRCNEFARKAHARNAHQVLGEDLKSPVAMVICWTKDGAIDAKTAVNAGGTRTAIVMAHQHGIPVFNLQRAEVRKLFMDWVGDELFQRASAQVKMTFKKKIASAKPLDPTAHSAPAHRAPQQMGLLDSPPSESGPRDAPAAPRRIQFRSSR
jgi:hypothetical protein